MNTPNQPDLTCVPYRRKGLYWALTIPFLLMLVLVFVYLWTINIVLSFGLLGLFLSMSYFQSYCCAYQDCPYVGGFCPAVIGILPGNWMAKLLFGNRPFVKSEKRFHIHVNMGISSWVALGLFPVYWLWQAHWGYAAGYLAAHVVYSIIFGLTICPVCAIRGTCPGGQFHVWVRNIQSGKS